MVDAADAIKLAVKAMEHAERLEKASIDALDLLTRYKERAEKAEAELAVAMLKPPKFIGPSELIDELAKARDAIAAANARAEAFSDDRDKERNRANSYVDDLLKAEAERNEALDYIKEARALAPQRLLKYTLAGIVKTLVEELSEAREDRHRLDRLTHTLADEKATLVTELAALKKDMAGAAGGVALMIEHQERRVTELLEANNGYLERARKAEREVTRLLAEREEMRERAVRAESELEDI